MAYLFPRGVIPAVLSFVGKKDGTQYSQVFDQEEVWLEYGPVLAQEKGRLEYGPVFEFAQKVLGRIEPEGFQVNGNMRMVNVLMFMLSILR